MKKTALLAFVLVLLSTALPLCVAGLLELQIAYASPYMDIDVATAYNMITNGSYPDLVVLDVRNQNEYDGGHIYGAVWIPVWGLEARVGELAGHENHEIIVYCKSGFRSQTASVILDSHNFTKVYNMVGGILAWQSAGYPVWIATVHNVNTTFNYDTIQAAIDAPQTLDGHTILVDAGTYYEHVNITKSISLIGENKHNTIIDGNSTGTVVNVTASNVNITSFTIQNSGKFLENSGVYIGEWSAGNNISCNIIMNNYKGIWLYNSNANAIYENSITNNDYGIQLHYSSHNSISRNNITNNYDGISIYESSNNILLGNEITANDHYGITLLNMPTSNNSIIGNNIEDNKYSGVKIQGYFNSLVGNEIVNNQYGITLDFSRNASISGNNITNNISNGILFFSSSDNSIHNNNISSNGFGVWFSPQSSNNKFYHNNFIDNIQHVYFFSSVYANFWDNGVEGNYWSNYSGVDSDHDGIGDTQHFIDTSNQDNCPLMGMFHSFNTSLGYYVNVVSNSTIEDFEYFESNSTIRMYVSNMTVNQTFGFCRVCIPKNLMSPPYNVIINDGTTSVLYFNGTVCENDTHMWIYFAYEHSTHKVDIIPEFPTWTSMLLILMVFTVAMVIYKRRLFKTSIH